MSSLYICTELIEKRIYFKLNTYVEPDVFDFYKQSCFNTPNVTFDKELKKYYCSVRKYIEVEYLLKQEGWEVLRSGSLRGIIRDPYKTVTTKNFRNLFDSAAVREGKALFDYQREDTNFIIRKSRTGNFSELGTGKAQPLYSKVLTPMGWKLFKDIRIGDIIINSQGGTSFIQGVYPQGIKKVYEVIFSDGSKTRCCEDHLWTVTTSNWKTRKQGYRLLPLSHLLHDYKPNNGIALSKYFIPVASAISFSKKEHFIHPYLLGYILGNGGLTVSSHIGISTADLEIIDTLATLIDSAYHIRKNKGDNYDYSLVKKNILKYSSNIYITELSRLGLMGCSSKEKFIPEEYLLDSVENRKFLLQGLMDSDGWIQRYSTCFASSSKQLIEDMKFLIRSLGGICTEGSKIPKIGNKEYSRSYTLTLNVPEDIKPFFLKRKSEKYKPHIKYKPIRGIRDIKYIGEEETQCISVSAADGLYITDDFVVTHNTVCGLAAFSYFYYRGFIDKIVIFVLGTLCDQWQQFILGFSSQFEKEDIIIGDNSNKFTIFNEDKKIFIIPYNLIPHIFCNLCSKVISKKKKIFQSKAFCYCDMDQFDLKEKLGSKKEMMLLCDESQELMNPKSVSFRILNNYKDFFEFRHIISGTPNINRFEQIWSQMSLLDDAIIGMPYLSFCRYIAKEMGVKVGKKIIKDKIKEYDPEKIKIIDERIKSWVLRRLKKDITWFHKNKQVDPIYYTLSPEHEALYLKLCNSEFDELREKNGVVYAVDIINNFPYLVQALDYPEMLKGKLRDVSLNTLLEDFDYTKTKKFLGLKEMIEQYMEKGEKLIIADWRPDLLDFFAKYFKKYGTEAIHGEQKVPKGQTLRSHRFDITNKFNDPDSDLRILFLNSMIGAGFNLNKCCKTLIFYNLSFDAKDFVQTQDRIFRVDNLWDCEVKILVYINTIDEKRYQSNLKRENINANMFGNKVLSVEEYRDIFLGKF